MIQTRLSRASQPFVNYLKKGGVVNDSALANLRTVLEGSLAQAVRDKELQGFDVNIRVVAPSVHVAAVLWMQVRDKLRPIVAHLEFRP